MKRSAPASPPSERPRFPYVPFYVDDWLSSDAIAGFTLEQEAAYLRLLLRQWKAPDGKLPKDEARLAGYSRLGARWAKVGRPIIKRCFVERGGAYVNPRLHVEWLRVRDKSQKAQAAAEERWGRERRNG
jgi:uncharacterized protein YdaU (DUF1376 family)